MPVAVFPSLAAYSCFAALLVTAAVGGGALRDKSEGRLRVCNAHPGGPLAVGVTRKTLLLDVDHRQTTLRHKGSQASLHPRTSPVSLAANVTVKGGTQWLTTIAHKDCAQLVGPWQVGDVVDMRVGQSPPAGLELDEGPQGDNGIILLVAYMGDPSKKDAINVQSATFLNEPKLPQMAVFDVEPGSLMRPSATQARLVHATIKGLEAPLSWDSMVTFHNGQHRAEVVGQTGSIESSVSFTALPGEAYGMLRLGPGELIVYPGGPDAAPLLRSTTGGTGHSAAQPRRSSLGVALVLACVALFSAHSTCKPA